MDIPFEKDTRGIRVHERGVIAQLCSPFRSHEQGLPEWFKNSSTAYARANAPTEYRVLTLLVGRRPDGIPYVALLDHVGMTVEDVEERFAHWGDPEAHMADTATDEILEGGHGNGGKCYMTQMFEHSSYLHSVSRDRGSRYGFIGDDPEPGYFPNRRNGRGFPVANATAELRRVLAELGVDFAKLPEEVRTAAAARNGFTMVVGLAPKHLTARDALKNLVRSVLHHAQMQITVQTTRIYVVQDGRPVPDLSPVKLPEIPPHEYAPDPRIFPIPDALEDPTTEEACQTRRAGMVPGQLILKTSKVSMRHSLKPRHHIVFIARGRPVAFMQMEDVSRSVWVDRMYGECVLDTLAEYETPDRAQLAEAPMTRAVRSWVKDRILEYDAEFTKRDRLEASQEQRNKLQELNKLLDRWKNRFLDDVAFGAGGEGGREGRRTPKPRPLPEAHPVRLALHCPYTKAGVGVWLRINVEFLDKDGNRVAPRPFLWNSSDWAVATIDGQNGVVTHTPGQTDVWVETVDGKLRSDSITIDVLDLVNARVEPDTLDLNANQIRQLRAVVTDRAGNDHDNVFLTWMQDDSSVLGVTATGKVIAHRQGTTSVCAVDERCVNNATGCRVSVMPPQTSSGDKPGRAYPQILLSDVDPDPLNPDGEPVRLSPEDGPVHQPTPQHVEHNIWFINLQCPLAKLYFEHFGPDTSQWRSYHLERFIEALAKIRLARDFQLAEEEITFDEVERRWREVAAEVQRRAIHDLRPFLEGGALPE